MESDKMTLVSVRTMDALKNIGLNLYERRLWVALLARGTSSAGELSEIANVPRSRAYDILQSLAEKGFVVIQSAKPIKYVTIAPAEALERVKNKLEENIRETQKRIEELKGSPVMRELNEVFSKGMKLVSSEELTGSLKGRTSITQQLNAMFREANKKINIITTQEGLDDLSSTHYEVLKKAKARGVKIRIASPSGSASTAVKSLSEVAEVKGIDAKELPVAGRFTVVDGKELVLSLTKHKGVHATQDMAFWSKSEHVAGDVVEPLFNLVWEKSKPV